MKVSPNHLALCPRTYPTRIHHIVHGRRAITAHTALRLARFCDLGAEFWVALQAIYDLDVARDELGDKSEKEVQSYGAGARRGAQEGDGREH